MPPAIFFDQRLLHDIVLAYWSHPTAWNEIGWGGPASPRGYVRMGYDERDPWEAAEARTATSMRCRTERTAMSADPLAEPRGKDGRAPDVFRPGAWVPMRQYQRGRSGRFRHRRHRRRRRHAGLPTGRSRLLRGRPRCRPVVPAAGGFRLRRIRAEQALLDRRPYLDGDNPLQLGSNNSGKAVGGSTVHFAMVSLRFRPEWFRARTSARLRRRLADRLARDVALLRRGRAGAEDRRARQLSLGSEAAALPVSRTRTERRRPRTRRRLRGAGHRVDAKRRWRRCRRRAAWRTRASIAASAPAAAPPTPSRARW